jgi:FkbM family methyltransferase
MWGVLVAIALVLPVAWVLWLVYLSRPRLVALPRSLAMWAFGDMEALVVYREIFDWGTYSKGGIEIKDGATVWDLGANIGMFSAFLASRHSNIRLRAVEPVPETRELLVRNLKTFTRTFSDLRVFDCAVGEAAASVPFTFSPLSSVGASMFPDDVMGASDSSQGLGAWLDAATQDLLRAGSLPGFVAAFIERFAQSLPVRTLLLAHFVAMVVATKLTTRRFDVRVRPFSELLAEVGDERVDFLKIDVEGAEEHVVRGICPEDWRRVQQVALEVHDVAGRVDRLAEMLAEQGFEVSRDREDWGVHKILRIVTLYGVRKRASTGTK